MPRIGVRLENDPRLSVPDLLDLAALAERLGFEVVWVPEGGGRDALTLLAACAGPTSTIKPPVALTACSADTTTESPYLIPDSGGRAPGAG